MNMDRMSRAWFEDWQVAGFGSLLEKPEGSKIIFQDPTPGVPKRYTATTWALGFRITEEMMEDDLYGIVGNKLSRALGRSVRDNFEVVAASVLNNAFNTAFTGFEAGVSLCSTAHTRLTGGTQANRPNADVDLALLPLQAAVEAFHGWTDEAGLQAVFVPKTLVSGVSQLWTSTVLLSSEQVPGSNFNDPNVLAQLGISPFTYHYLTDPDAWFLIGSDHDMNYFDRVNPRFKNTDDFKTGDALFACRRRNAAGYGDWRGVYGTQGA